MVHVGAAFGLEDRRAHVPAFFLSGPGSAGVGGAHVPLFAQAFEDLGKHFYLLAAHDQVVHGHVRGPRHLDHVGHDREFGHETQRKLAILDAILGDLRQIIGVARPVQRKHGLGRHVDLGVAEEMTRDVVQRIRLQFVFLAQDVEEIDLQDPGRLEHHEFVVAVGAGREDGLAETRDLAADLAEAEKGLAVRVGVEVEHGAAVHVVHIEPPYVVPDEDVGAARAQRPRPGREDLGLFFEAPDVHAGYRRGLSQAQDLARKGLILAVPLVHGRDLDDLVTLEIRIRKVAVATVGLDIERREDDRRTVGDIVVGPRDRVVARDDFDVARGLPATIDGLVFFHADPPGRVEIAAMNQLEDRVDVGFVQIAEIGIVGDDLGRDRVRVPRSKDHAEKAVRLAAREPVEFLAVHAHARFFDDVGPEPLPQFPDDRASEVRGVVIAHGNEKIREKIDRTTRRFPGPRAAKHADDVFFWGFGIVVVVVVRDLDVVAVPGRHVKLQGHRVAFDFYQTFM